MGMARIDTLAIRESVRLEKEPRRGGLYLGSPLAMTIQSQYLDAVAILSKDDAKVMVECMADREPIRQKLPKAT